MFPLEKTGMVSKHSLVPTKVSQGRRQLGPEGFTEFKGGAADLTCSGSGSSPDSRSLSASKSAADIPMSFKFSPRYGVSVSANAASALLVRTSEPEGDTNVIAPSRVRRSS